MTDPEPNQVPDPNPIDPATLHDLEIKDAQLIFNEVWEVLEEEFGRAELRFPKELILLGGAPGSGKGTHTRYMLKSRGLTCAPIVVSGLLNSPEAQKIKDNGGMVGDREVIELILREMLKPDYRDGAVLDGFPRTHVQVECLKLLVNRMNQLRREFYDSALAIHFRKPIIHIMVLFVDERTSIDRQLKRGEQNIAHNKEVEETGIGRIREIRKTDLSEEAARHRYRVFKEKTWEALQSLKEIYFYHFINANGTIEEVEANIIRELKYQSSLELDPRTFDRLRHLPLASETVNHARQDLVRRLDSYEIEHPELFHRVVDFVRERVMPIVLRHAISGRAVVNSEDNMLEDPAALAMLIDIFSERGYHAVVDLQRIPVPWRFDPETHLIDCREKKIYHIKIYFPGSEIRRG